MAKQVNIHAAKTHFSKLVDEVEAGGEVIIARAGKPVLKLVKIDDELPVIRKFGALKDQIRIDDWDAFDALDEEIWAPFWSKLESEQD